MHSTLFRVICASGASGTVAAGPIGSYIGTAVDTANNSTYTFNTQDIGAAHASRVVLVGIVISQGATLRTINSVTIGGNAATIHGQIGSSSNQTVGFASLAVAAGTTATIVVGLSGSPFACRILVWRVLPTSPTPLDYGDNTGTTPIEVANVEVKSGGFLAVLASRADAGGSAVGYTGIDTLIQDATDLAVETPVCDAWSVNTTENSTTNDVSITGSGNGKLTTISFW